MFNKLWLEENTIKVKLPDNKVIYQHKEGQKISSDNELFNKILFERFHNSKNFAKHVLELGLGNGINSIMLKSKFPSWDITGIEIDDEQARLASYNCQLLNIDLNIIEGDLRHFCPERKFDLIIANPPYQKLGSGKQSPKERTNLAKFELTCNMDDVFIALERNIAPAGEAWLLYSQNREEDLENKLNEGLFKKIEMLKEKKIVIVGLKYVANQ